MALIDDIRTIQGALDQLKIDTAACNRGVAELDTKTFGERGLSAALDNLTKEVASLRKAAYWVAGIIVAGSITFSFSVLALVG